MYVIINGKILKNPDILYIYIVRYEYEWDDNVDDDDYDRLYI